MKKRLISIVLVLGLSFACTLTAFAQGEVNEGVVFKLAGESTQPLSGNEALIDEQGNIIANPSENVAPEPRYVPCPVFPGKHQMKSRGGGDVYINGVRTIAGGVAVQCTACGDTIISERSPLYSYNIGYYGYRNHPYPLSNYTKMETDRVYYCGDTRTDSFFDSFYWL